MENEAGRKGDPEHPSVKWWRDSAGAGINEYSIYSTEM